MHKIYIFKTHADSTPMSALPDAPGAPISTEASLRDALADCLWTGRDRLPVDGGGVVTLAALRERAAGAGIGAAASAGRAP